MQEKLLTLYKKNKCEIIAAFAGMVVFILVYGYKVLNPINFSWMYHGFSKDLTQNYLGWEGFRNSAWTFPLGLMDQLTYPNKVSIIFTDSIPLFALFFKLFSPILPVRFQYFGLWGIMTYVLNGIIAAKILKRYLRSVLDITIGSLFFILSFQMLERMYYHSALAAHWLMLFAIYAVMIRRELSIRNKILVWSIIGMLCPLVHSYYLLFDGIFLVGFIIAVLMDKEGVEKTPKQRILVSAAVLAAFILSGLLMLFILGAFYTSVANIGGDILQHRLDLTGFINEKGAGYFAKYLSFYSEVHRSYYLGLGIILLSIYTLFRIIRDKNWEFFKKRKETVIALSLVFIIALIVACSPKVTLNGYTIIHYSVPEFIMKVWSVFRNTARTSWVCMYLIFIFAICADCGGKRSMEKKTAALVFAFLIQFLDMSPYLLNAHENIVRESSVKQFDERINSAFMDSVVSSHGIKHIIFGPEYTIDLAYLTGYAMSRHLTTNIFRLAQGNNYDEEEFKKQLYSPDPESLYILRKKKAEYAYDDCGINWMDVGDYIIGIVGEWQIDTADY